MRWRMARYGYGRSVMWGAGWVRRVLSLAVVATALSPAVGSGPASAQPAGIDPKALEILKRSTDFLGAQPRFAAETRNSLEVVLASGQKLQFGSTVSMTVRRPDRMWAKRSGDLIDQVFYYDGKRLMLHEPARKVYATVPAPGTLEEMLEFARTKLDVFAPGGDFVGRDAYPALTDGVTSAFVVGKAVVEGVTCDHLAFRAPHADWQLWIEHGSRPLPRKLVITTRDVVSAPQFDVTVTRWNLAPEVDDAVFRFEAPPGASTVEFLRPAVPSTAR